jgi:hypothetical protein
MHAQCWIKFYIREFTAKSNTMFTYFTVNYIIYVYPHLPWYNLLNCLHGSIDFFNTKTMLIS